MILKHQSLNNLGENMRYLVQFGRSLQNFLLIVSLSTLTKKETK